MYKNSFVDNLFHISKIKITVKYMLNFYQVCFITLKYINMLSILQAFLLVLL